MTATSAPASSAVAATRAVYAGSKRNPSKKCSQSRNTRRPSVRKNDTVSRTIARFSSRVVRSARSTCRTSDLATRHTTGVSASSTARTCGSASAFRSARRVAPKATSSACFRSSSERARRKNSVSFGIAPGHPPSMKPTPNSSSSRAMASLSTTEYVTPSRWAPSRSVVSKTWYVIRGSLHGLGSRTLDAQTERPPAYAGGLRAQKLLSTRASR